MSRLVELSHIKPEDRTPEEIEEYIQLLAEVKAKTIVAKKRLDVLHEEARANRENAALRLEEIRAKKSDIRPAELVRIVDEVAPIE